jgi:ribosomal protein L40E
MSGITKKAELRKSWGSADRFAVDEWSYPTGMVWCPMKMSGMAVMKCAQLQKQLGCGSLRQFTIMKAAKPANVSFFWPWLRHGRECPERANEKEVRELRLALSPLRLVEKGRKNFRAAHCPACGGGKSFGARQCRRCWYRSVRK